MTFALPELENPAAGFWPLPGSAARFVEEVSAAQLKLFASALDLWLLPLSTIAGEAPAHALPAAAPEEAVATGEPVLAAIMPQSEAAEAPAAAIEAAAPSALQLAPTQPQLALSAAPAAADDVAGVAPALFEKPAGRPDDLLRIKGIGPKLGQLLNSLGVWHYSQIVDWTPAEVAWVNDKIDFRGRIQREGWQAQAAALMAPAKAA